MSVDRYRRQFGSIKPLPGQPGYGMKESERLLHETKNMEHKLNKLKAVMSQQREERGVKTGGRWASARSDRGSLRNYNKDVKSGATRRKYIKHNVHSWGTTEVSLWLTALKLERYIDSFVQNEISGSVLLDVGQDDLDYMSITVLGHRKTILKEIEKLKRGRSTVALPKGGKKSKSLVPSPPDSKRSSGPYGKGRNASNYDPSPQKKSSARKIHWSQAKPLAENSVSGGTVPVNLADGDYDEQRQRDSFQAAVMEWRNSAATETSTETESSGLWSNPFGAAAGNGIDTKPRSPVVQARKNNLLSGELDEAAEHEAFRKAVDEWRNGGVANGKKSASSSSGIGYSPNDQKGEISPQLKQRHEKNVKHAPANTASGQTGGRFLRGGLDEELEHKKFAAAVDAWRTGKTEEKAKSPTRDIAKQLNKQMEEARVRRIEKFNKEKHALAQEMQKAKDELAMRKAKALEKIAAEKSKVVFKPSEPKTDYSKIWDIEIEY